MSQPNLRSDQRLLQVLVRHGLCNNEERGKISDCKPLNGRNSNHRLLLDDGRQLVLKEYQTEVESCRQGFEREIRFLAAAARADVTAWQFEVPTLVSQDTAHKEVIIDFLSGIGLDQLHTWHHTDLPQALAKALASLHASLDVHPFKTGPLSQLPTALRVRPEDEPYFHQMNSLSQNYLDSVTNDDPVVDSILDCQRNWQSSHVIHGDLRATHVLVNPTSDRPDISFVDFEHTEIGDPAWDIAGILQEFAVADSNANQCYEPGTPAEGALKFLSTYMASSKMEAAGHTPFLIRSVGYTGARLIQTVVEFLQCGQDWTPQLRHLSIMARFFLLDSRLAAKSLHERLI